MTGLRPIRDICPPGTYHRKLSWKCGSVASDCKEHHRQAAKVSSLSMAITEPANAVPLHGHQAFISGSAQVDSLPDVHIVDLRHSYASALAASGVSLYMVGKPLGHVDVASQTLCAFWRMTH